MFKMNNTLNWYQESICFLKIGIKMLIGLLTIGIKILFLCSLSIGIKMHFIDIFLIGIIFDLTPYGFWFRQKGGEHLIFFHSPLFHGSLFHTKRGRKFCFCVFTPLLMIDKKGEKNLS